MTIGKTGSSPSSSPSPLKRLEDEAGRAEQKVLGEVQGALFDGWVGRTLSSGVDAVVASGAKALGLDAYQRLPPAPTLTRPVVMVTGLFMEASSYDPMASHLASNPKNGQAAVYSADDGRFHLGGVGGRVMSEPELRKAKVFQVQYRDVRGAPTEKAPQLARAFAEIERVTQAPAMDVVAHSAGCTDFRLYLDSRDQAAKDAVKFDQVMLIGPASHGTFMGNVGQVAGGVLGVKEAGAQLALGSPLVAQLNTRWDAQRAQAKAVSVIGIGGAPTVSSHGLTNGDGFMPVDALSLPGAETVVLEGADPTPVAHLVEVAYSGVLAEVDKRLAR